MSTEEWRAVPGWEGLYEVSDLGQVRSIDRDLPNSLGHVQHFHGRVLRQNPDTQGYMQVTIERPLRCALVHHLVLEAFGPPRPLGAEGRHDDGDQINNAATNLLWGTRAENMADQVRHGTHGFACRVRCKRRHLLAAPNLVEVALPIRSCRACRYARNVGYKARAHGRPAVDLQAVSDRRYAEIMGEVAPCA